MKRLIFGSLLLLFIIIAALFLEGDAYVDAASRLSPPTGDNIMGTDAFGRSLSAMIGKGVLVSIAIASAITALSFAAGIMLSFLFFSWEMPNPLFITAMLAVKSIPPVILALFLNALSGPGILKLIAVLSIGQMANIATTAYSRVAVLRNEEFVLASFGLGKSRLYVFRKHIIPALIPYIALQSVSVFLSSILSESSLSFLGCGVPVTTATIGSILAEARATAAIAPWTVVFPAAILLLIGIALECIISALSKLDTSAH